MSRKPGTVYMMSARCPGFLTPIPFHIGDNTYTIIKSMQFPLHLLLGDLPSPPSQDVTWVNSPARASIDPICDFSLLFVWYLCTAGLGWRQVLLAGILQPSYASRVPFAHSWSTGKYFITLIANSMMLIRQNYTEWQCWSDMSGFQPSSYNHIPLCCKPFSIAEWVDKNMRLATSGPTQPTGWPINL